MKSKYNALISVIVPVYNVEPYLSEAIESIIQQTYKNLEIILVDDGSTDGSGEICDRYAIIDSRIKVIRQQNKGLSAARNAGLDNCKGDIIAFLDSDDAYCRNAISVMYHEMHRTDADIVECEYASYPAGSRLSPKNIEKNHKLFPNDIKHEGVYDRRSALRLKVDDYIANNVWSKLYKKEIWKGIRFHEGRNYEDLDIIMSLIIKADKVALIQDSLIMRRVRPGSIEKTYTVRNLTDKISACCHYRYFVPEYFDEKHLHKIEINFYVMFVREYNNTIFFLLTEGKEYRNLMDRAIRYFGKNVKNVDLTFKQQIVSVRVFPQIIRTTFVLIIWSGTNKTK